MLQNRKRIELKGRQYRQRMMLHQSLTGKRFKGNNALAKIVATVGGKNRKVFARAVATA